MFTVDYTLLNAVHIQHNCMNTYSMLSKTLDVFKFFFHTGNIQNYWLLLAWEKVAECLSKVGVEDGVDDGVQGGVQVAKPGDEDLNLRKSC